MNPNDFGNFWSARELVQKVQGLPPMQRRWLCRYFHRYLEGLHAIHAARAPLTTHARNGARDDGVRVLVIRLYCKHHVDTAKQFLTRWNSYEDMAEVKQLLEQTFNVWRRRAENGKLGGPY